MIQSAYNFGHVIQMIFKRQVPIPALLCSIGLITNHGHNESDCTVGEREKWRLQFFCLIDQGPLLSLGPQGMQLGITPEGVSFLDQKKASNLVGQRQIAVKMLLAGSELTKEDRESQLYDEFERFKMLPGENINEYYVRFHKLVNDMRNIRITMPNI
ncbi:hypothetical protein Tco_0410413 [Tanacetum coccineum]